MLDHSIEEARTKLTDTELLRGRLEGEINVLKEQIHSARGNEEHMKSRFDTLHKEIDSKNIDKEAILKDKTRLTGNWPRWKQ